MTECETETLDKLYLEWSQFTKARNHREIAVREQAKNLRAIIEGLGMHGTEMHMLANDIVVTLA